MATSDQLLAELKNLHPKLIDLSLGRIERLLAKLGSPQTQLPPIIHVAGTNGKGSTGAFVTAILEAAGCAVHVYSSPHLVRFHERIVLGRKGGRGTPISEAQLCDVLQRTQAVNDGGDITQFEITTAAAFLAFSEEPADALVLEVGLGGRLDATNVIPAPAMTILTPISMDHADKLGDTLGKIAAEKAGILKSGVPAIISRQEPAALSVIRTIGERVGAKLSVWGEDFDAYEQRGRLIVQHRSQLLDLGLPALVGGHQITNAGTAVAAAAQLGALGVTDDAIERGLARAVWPARMERLAVGPLPEMLRQGAELWLDGGHNPAAGEALAQTVADLEERSSKPLYLIVGMLGLKDAAGFLAPFAGLARHIATVPVAQAPDTAQTPQALAEIARSVGFDAEPMTDIGAALRFTDALSVGPKRILICGSLYLAGETLALQQGVAPQPN